MLMCCKNGSSEINSIYSMADIFVMCSGVGETWGLSVNEAMNFSLPVIVSSTCGSSFDLVDNGQNGFVFKEGDILELAGLIKLLGEQRDDRIRFGAYSKVIINNFTHAISCMNILKRMCL